MDHYAAHARAIHGEICCQGSVFDVVHTTVKISDDLTYCETHLIIYEMLKSNTRWRVLDSTQKNESVTDGLNTLMEKLKGQMHASISKPRHELFPDPGTDISLRSEWKEQQEKIADEKEKKDGYY